MDEEDVILTKEPVQDSNLRLSSSQISTYKQCSRKWKFRYVDKIYGDSTIAMVLGTFVHSIFENLFLLENSDRTIDAAKKIAREQWEILVTDEEFLKFNLDEPEQKDFRVNAWILVNTLWDLENPQKVNVIDVEKKVEFDIADGISMIGFIDRLSEVNGRIDIIDYKTGKRPHKNYESDKVSQIYLYALAVSKLMDGKIGKGKLLFLGGKDPGIVSRSITQQIIDDTEEKLLDDANEIFRSKQNPDNLPASTGPLCGWCDFFPYCEEGQEYVIDRISNGSFRSDAPAALMLKDVNLIEAVRALNNP